MIKLVVTNEKNLELYELEKVHVGENKFGYYLIFLPEILNDYNLSECEVKLIQIFEDNTSVAINVDTTQEMRPIKEFITLDATAQAQTVTLSVLITHKGDVIGKTNQKTYQVYPTKNATPIDPREELDEIIADLRADKAELEETVSEQAETITSQGNQITELSGEIADLNSEVTELTSDNTRLENLTDTQRETIQNMIDNPPQPKLYTPPVITPSGSVQQINPPTGYDGLSSVTVAPVITPEIRLQNKLVEPTSNTQLIEADEGYDGLSSVSVTGTSYMNIDLQKWVSPSPDDEPFEMIFDKAVRSYIAYNQTKMIKATILTATSIESSAFYSCTGLQSVVFPASLISIGNNAFQNCTSLMELTLPDSLTSIGTNAFYSCTSLMELTLPDSLTSIGTSAFQNCTSLTELTLPDSLTSIGVNAFQNCTSLTELTLAQGFNCNGLNVSSSTRFTTETIVACLEALADRTGQTAYTITFGTKNLNKLTAEQKAIAINKNWNLN